MKPVPIRMLPRLRGTLLALAVAAMVSQASGASAAAGAVSRSVALPGTASIALSGERPQLSVAAIPSPRTPGSEGWALLLAGVLGACAIGHRRLAALGSRSLDPHGLRRG